MSLYETSLVSGECKDLGMLKDVLDEKLYGHYSKDTTKHENNYVLTKDVGETAK
jgi:hypothetical protein